MVLFISYKLLFLLFFHPFFPRGPKKRDWNGLSKNDFLKTDFFEKDRLTHGGMYSPRVKTVCFKCFILKGRFKEHGRSNLPLAPNIYIYIYNMLIQHLSPECDES